MVETFLVWNWIGVHAWKDLKYDIFHFALVGVYTILLVIAIFFFARYQYNSTLFKAFLLTGILTRLIYFGSQPFIMEGILQISNSINIMLNTLSSFLFFSGYTMLLFFWLVISHFSFDFQRMQIYKTNQPYNLKTLDRSVFLTFIVFNTIMYATVLTLYVLDFTIGAKLTLDTTNNLRVPTPINTYEEGIFLLAAILYITVSLGFFIYGYCALRYVYYENLGWSLKHLEQRRLLLRRVAAITIVCMFCFIVRSAVTLLGLFDDHLDNAWWLDGIYYSCLEVLPLVMMLRAYYPKKHKSLNHKSPLIRDSK